jgi:hypothetical protein
MSKVVVVNAENVSFLLNQISQSKVEFFDSPTHVLVTWDVFGASGEEVYDFFTNHALVIEGTFYFHNGYYTRITFAVKRK